MNSAVRPASERTATVRPTVRPRATTPRASRVEVRATSARTMTVVNAETTRPTNRESAPRVIADRLLSFGDTPDRHEAVMTLPALHPVAARPAPLGSVAIRAGGGVVIQHRTL